MSEMKVTIKGKEVLFESNYTDEEALEKLKNIDDIYKNKFACSLMSKGRKTPTMKAWIHYLVYQNENLKS